MTSYQTVMLVAGAALFVVAVVLVVYCVIKRRPFAPLIVMFPIAIIMIGFPSIKSFKLAGAEVELSNSLAELRMHPEDPTAKARVGNALEKLETLVAPETATPAVAEQAARGHLALGATERALEWAKAAEKKSPDTESTRKLVERVAVTRLSNALPSDLSQPPSSATHSNLAAAVADLSRRPSLSPESYLAMSQAQLVLGQTNRAATNLSHALTLSTNLTIDPRLRMLLKPTPQ